MVLVVAGAHGAVAQVDTTARRDSVRADTMRADTTHADSLRRDSLRAEGRRADSLRQSLDPTARYLEGERLKQIRVPVVSLGGNGGPRPPTARIVLTRDSIRWDGAQTVADLLTRVPGVFVWRAGWIGRAEIPTLQGRGSTAVEYVLDGVPYLPLGPDSVAVDASLFALSLLERIEVERWPGMLRVYLYTRREERLAARSELGISTGSGEFTRYLASLERRSRNGFAFGVAADYLKNGVSGGADAYRNTQVWLFGGWVPSPRFGVTAQLIRSRPDRVATTDAFGTPLELPLTATRSELQLRAGFRSRPEPLGTSLDVIVSRSGWDDKEGSVAQHRYQVGAIGEVRRPAASASVAAFYRSRWTPVDLRLRVNGAAFGPLLLSAEGTYQRHEGGRSSRWAGAHLGVQLPYGFMLGGAARIGRAVAAPSILTDPEQDLKDAQVTFSWHRPRLGFELGIATDAPYQPEGFRAFGLVPNLVPAERTKWLSAAGHIAPFPWMTIESWFTTPRPVTAEGQPPALAVTRGTIQSKFLRAFPSGIFNLKLQLAVERWSNGVLGHDATGEPVRTPNTVFIRSLVELQLSGLTFFWDQRNLTAGSKSYVPGYPIARYSRVLGARWEFAN